MANAVKVTLGPAARTVVLEKSWGSPTIINDGVTIAKDISFQILLQNMGAKLVQEVASKTQDNAGDGRQQRAFSLKHYATQDCETSPQVPAL